MKKIIILIVLLVAGYFGYNYYKSLEQNSNNELVFYGNVETRQVNIAFRVNGKIQEIYVNEGDKVKKGQLLAKLEPYPYDINYELAKTQVEVQKAQLAKLETGYQTKEIEQAKAQVDGRRATVNNLQISLNRINTLKNDGVVPQQQLDDARARLTEAQAALRASEEQYTLMTDGFRIEDINAQKAALKLTELQTEQAKIAFEDTSLFSDLDGIIVSKVIENGSIIAAGQTVFTLTLNSPTYIRAYITQPKLAFIKYGQEVELNIDALPDKKYIGTVGFISPSAEFTPRSVETLEVRNDLVYRMRILVDDVDDVFRQGMPVTIKIKE